MFCCEKCSSTDACERTDLVNEPVLCDKCYKEVLNGECNGCKYEKSTDIKVHLEICTHCKRAYRLEEDRDIHEDRYITK